MRRMLLVLGCGLLLACGGLAEQLAETVTGGEVSLREDGMAVDLPDGARVSIDWGDAARHPASLDLSPVPGGTVHVSGTVAAPDQPDAAFAVYGTDRGAEDLLGRYREELAAKGLSGQESVNEDGAHELRAAQGDLHYVISIAESTDGSGQRVVTLGKGSPKALEQALDANPR